VNDINVRHQPRNNNNNNNNVIFLSFLDAELYAAVWTKPWWLPASVAATCCQARWPAWDTTASPTVSAFACRCSRLIFVSLSIFLLGTIRHRQQFVSTTAVCREWSSQAHNADRSAWIHYGRYVGNQWLSDQWPVIWVNRPLQVSHLGQRSLRDR